MMFPLQRHVSTKRTKKEITPHFDCELLSDGQAQAAASEFTRGRSVSLAADNQTSSDRMQNEARSANNSHAMKF